MQRDFAFHACLGPEVSQADVLHMCGIPQLLDAALAGYNVTVFAYGQTGAGCLCSDQASMGNAWFCSTACVLAVGDPAPAMCVARRWGKCRLFCSLTCPY